MVSEEEPGWTVLFGIRPPQARVAGLGGRAGAGRSTFRVSPTIGAPQRDTGFPRRLCLARLGPRGRGLLRWGASLPRGMGKGGPLHRWGWDCPIRGEGIPIGPLPLDQRSGRSCGRRESQDPHLTPPRPVSLQEPGAPAPCDGRRTQPQGLRMLGCSSLAGAAFSSPTAELAEWGAAGRP